MGTLLTLLALGGFGGLGWWVATRDDDDTPPPPRPDAPPLALPPPAPAELPPAELPSAELPVPPSARASEPKGEQPNGTRYVAPRYTAPPVVAPVVAPSDFVHRMRRWLEGAPPPTQIELVAVNLERAGHRETATQLRALASDRRRVESPSAAPEAAPADPPEPASPPASDGSPESSPESASDSSPNTGGGSAAPSAPSAPRPPADAPANARQVQALARRVAAMLREREGQGTDRRLVRAFQLAARVFPARGENPSGLYGPATREALARFGVRNPPRPRFRAAVEAGPPRTRPNVPGRPRAPRRGARPNAPRPNAPRPSTTRPSSAADGERR